MTYFCDPDYWSKVDSTAEEILLLRTTQSQRAGTLWHSRDHEFLIDPEEENEHLENLWNDHELHWERFNELIYEEAETKVERRSAYQEYLQSEYWNTVKSTVEQRSQNRCESCQEVSFDLQVHHKWYPARYTEMDHLDALMHLCPACHKKAHHK